MVFIILIGTTYGTNFFMKFDNTTFVNNYATGNGGTFSHNSVQAVLVYPNDKKDKIGARFHYLVFFQFSHTRKRI